MPFIDKDTDFIGKHKIGIWVSAFIVVVSVVLLVTRGLNLGVDFSGGLLVEARFTQDVATDDIRTLFDESDGPAVTVQDIGSATDTHDVLLRAPVLKEQEGVAKDAAMIFQNILTEAYPDAEILKAEYVGPKVGKELIKSGVISVSLAFFMMLIYIWLRFEWQYGIGAVVALIHDTIAALGFFSLTQIEFNLASVAALLTVIGYSINDSVVIFDRIRENFRSFKTAAPEYLINLSIHQNMARTLLTSLTTMLALTALSVFGGHAIGSFSLVALFGVVIGTHSTIFLASPLLSLMRLRHQEEQPI